MQRASPEKLPRIAIIGGGPAGLTAGYILSKAKLNPVIYERSSLVGGISRTEIYEGYRFDMGGHRFFSRLPEIRSLWHEILGADFLLRPRLSRIFYRGRFIDYPLHPLKATISLGPVETVRVLASLALYSCWPHKRVTNFAQWVSNRFGKRLFEIFFKTYTEKVWGVSTEELSHDWAAQRIKNLSLGKAIANALGWRAGVTSLIEEFHYPRFGPGMMWTAAADRLRSNGGRLLLNTELRRLHHEDGVVRAVSLESPEGTTRESVDYVVSSSPLPDLVASLDPSPPEAVRYAANLLRYRDMVVVGLIVDHPDLFADNWIYVHDPSVKVARIQNFKNWSADMVPEPSRTSLGCEYFCTAGDDLWTRSDADLIELAKSEIAEMGFCKANKIIDGCVFRVPRAYPLYDAHYREHVDVIRQYLAGFRNLQTIGRNGQHRYDNQDHAMLAGIYAAQNIIDGGGRDAWSVNTEQTYQEELPR